MIPRPFRSLPPVLLAPALFAVPPEGALPALRPRIFLFYPHSGPVGTTVSLFGKGFARATRVTIGATPATFTALDDLRLTLKVPAGATSGPIRVSTPEGSATSPGAFVVTGVPAPAPAIASFVPTQGPAGTVVVLSGTNFTSNAEVAFHGAPAAQVTFVSATQIKATVPAGATSGPITVTTAAGTATSAASFTVTAAPPPPPPAPAIASFTPIQGPVGTVVVLSGANFTSSATVAFHGAPAAQVTFVSAAQIKASVPAGATSGPITVTTAAGTATSAASFTVTAAPPPPPPAPAIASFVPTQGPVGTVVTLAGSGFTAGATVAFHGAPAAQVTFVSAAQIKATVPAGATSGPITVTTAAGTATSAASFTVAAAPPPPGAVDYSIGGWYLTQSVQTLDRSIPLVAGRDGCLRVFALASGTNQGAPPVRVTITGGTPSPWVQTIPAPGAAVPTALQEGTLAASWNLAVPGAVLAPGGTLKLELDPAGTLPDSNPANNVVQADLAVQAVKPFHTTLIPVTQQGLAGNVTTGRTLASWVERLQRMYPLAAAPGGVDVALGAPYTTQANLNSGQDGWSQLLGEIEKKRVAEAGTRYYFGAVNVSYSGGIAGLGYVGAPSAIGWDKTGYSDGGNYPEVLAHEVGHNFGRRHAPCGVSDPDPAWPTDAAHADAHIGVYGYDPAAKALLAPTTEDVMSYCSPVWVSDYTYRGVLAFRASSPIGAVPEAPEADCLLVSGRIGRDGRVELDPAYTLKTRPSPPQGDEYLLQLLDGSGVELLRVPFAPASLADLPIPGERHFAFALPLPPGAGLALRSLRVWAGGSVVAVRQGGVGGPPSPPAAVVSGPGRVRVTWDEAAAPAAMVRDPADGKVLAFAQGGSVDLACGLPALDVVLSNGVVGFPFHVAVAP